MMSRFKLVLLASVLFCQLGAGAGVDSQVQIVLQNAQTGNANGTILVVDKFPSLGLQVTVSGVATVNFEVSVDNQTTWSAMKCTLMTTLATASTVTATGTYQCGVGGMSHFRARTSGNTGSVTVKANLVAAGGSGGGGGGSGGTGNCPTDSGGTDTSDLTLHSCKSTIVNALQLTNIVTKSGLTLSGRTAWTNAGASGNLTIVAGIASQAIKVYEFEIWCNGANNWFIQSGTTNTPPTKHYTQNFAAGQNKIYDLRGDEWFIFRSTSTATDNDFIINFSAAQTCSGFVNYTQG